MDQPPLTRPPFPRLTAEQQHYLEEGIRHRNLYYMDPLPERDLDYELTLALSWFRNWWQQQADRQAVRNRDLLTLPLPGLELEPDAPNGCTHSSSASRP